jgi:hypothetical protein
MTEFTVVAVHFFSYPVDQLIDHSAHRQVSTSIGDVGAAVEQYVSTRNEATD